MTLLRILNVRLHKSKMEKYLLILIILPSSLCHINESSTDYKRFCLVGKSINVVSFIHSENAGFEFYTVENGVHYVARGNFYNCKPNVTQDVSRFTGSLPTRNDFPFLRFVDAHGLYLCQHVRGVSPGLLRSFLGCPPSECFPFPIDGYMTYSPVRDTPAYIVSGRYYFSLPITFDLTDKTVTYHYDRMERTYMKDPRFHFPDMLCRYIIYFGYLKKGTVVHKFNLTSFQWLSTQQSLNLTDIIDRPLANWSPSMNVESIGACANNNRFFILLNETHFFNETNEMTTNYSEHLAESLLRPYYGLPDDMYALNVNEKPLGLVLLYNWYEVNYRYWKIPGDKMNMTGITRSRVFDKSCQGIWLSYAFTNNKEVEKLYNITLPSYQTKSRTVFSLTGEPSEIYPFDELIVLTLAVLMVISAGVVVTLSFLLNKKSAAQRFHFNKGSKGAQKRRKPKQLAEQPKFVLRGPTSNRQSETSKIPIHTDLTNVTLSAGNTMHKEDRPRLVPLRGPDDLITFEKIAHLDYILVDHTNVLLIDSKILEEANVDRRELRAGDKFVRDKYGHKYLNFYRSGKGRPLMQN